VRVHCTDQRCHGRLNSLTAYVADSCIECPYGWLDMGPATYKHITGGQTTGMYQIRWDFVDCGTMVKGNIMLKLHDRMNPWFFAVNIMNSNEVVQQVSLGKDGVWYPLKHEVWNYYTYTFPGDRPLRPPYKLEIISEKGNKRVVSVKTVTPGRVLRTRRQFGSSRDSHNAVMPSPTTGRVEVVASRFNSRGSGVPLGSDGTLALWSNGCIKQRFHLMAKAVLSVEAKGTFASGYPLMRVSVGGIEPPSGTRWVDTTDYRMYFWDIMNQQGDLDVQICFVNDYSDSSGDRNLFIRKVSTYAKMN